jgi:hypothetical protein
MGKYGTMPSSTSYGAASHIPRPHIYHIAPTHVRCIWFYLLEFSYEI